MKWSINLQIPSIGTLEYEADNITDFIAGFEGLFSLRKQALALSEKLGVSEVVTGEGQYPHIEKAESYPDAVIKLLSRPEWGKQPRTLNELHAALEMNAVHIEKKALGSMLTKLVRSNRLSRVKKDGHFAYMIPLQQRQ